MLQIRLLGGLGLEASGQAIEPPPGRPARALLAWLALHPGMHARSRVAAALWPDVLDESARISLRSALTALRRALGEEANAVIATREQIGLAPDVSVDVSEFDALVQDCRPEEAVELHHGDLLPELDHDWVLEARDERRSLLADAIARLADAEEERGDLAAAVRHSRRLVAIDPLSEEAQRALIRRLAVSGDRAGALATFERLRERLRVELGIAPAAETSELVAALRRGDAGRPGVVGAEQPPLPGAIARGHRSPFVGRGDELGKLRERWRRATPEPQLVALFGDPGVGKSRLAAELARAVHAEGATVLLGRCSEEPLLPYQPFAEALRPYLQDSASPPAGLGELERLVPGLADRGGAEWGAEPEVARFRLFDAVRALLSRASGERRLLLVLEDLHWADRPTLRLLSHLMRAQEPARLLVLVTYRQTELRWADPLAGALAELRRERIGTRLRLGGLDERDVAALVSDWIGPGAPPELPIAIHRRTEGNAFFVEEVLSHLSESGGELAGVPEGVKEVIGWRLNRLQERTRRALAAACVLGRRFDVHVLEDVVEKLPAAELADALDEALGAGFIREEAERAGRFTFSHALVREALYEQLAGARRTALHARAAAAFERLYGERPDRVGEIAHHLLEAAVPSLAERGIAYAVRAADLALDQLAYEDAALQVARALRAFDLIEGADEARRCELLLALGDARMRAGDRSGGRAAFGQAAEAARPLGRSDLLARAALGFGGLGVTILGVDEATVALLEEGLAALGESDPALRARLLARLAVELYYGPSRERSEALGAEAIEIARRAGDEQALAYALNARHVSLWRADRLGERLGIAREMMALAARTGDREGELQGRNWLVTDLFEAGEMADLDGEIVAYEALAKQLRLPAYEWYALLWRGALAALRGEFARAEPLLREAVRLGTRSGDRNVELADQVRLAIHWMRGDFEAAYAHYAPMAKPKIGTSPASLSFRCGWAFLAAASGREAEAREHLEHIASHGLDRMPFDVNWLETVGTLGEACTMLGDADRAAQLYELLLPYHGRLEAVAGRALVSWGVADRHLGMLAAAISRFADAERHFEAALSKNARLGFRPWLAWTRYQYAQMLLARPAAGYPELAAELLAAAAELAEELGLSGLERRIAALSGPGTGSATIH